MLNAEGRRAATVDDAKSFIRKFMRKTLLDRDESGYVKHYEMDLYLPMMMDWVLNVPGEKDEEYTSTDILEHLYMDAAWELCVDGYLRPGPRATNSEAPGDSYGKGYSLTRKGTEWMNQDEPPHHEPTGNQPPQDVPTP